MHQVVDDVPSLSEIDGINDFIVAVILVTVKIRCLSPMTLERISMT